MTNLIAAAIQELGDPGGPSGAELRSYPRERFFRPVTVILADGTQHDAFTRNISRDGIGLVHRMPLPVGPLRFEIQLRTGSSVQVDAELIWCRPGEDLYTSGARFLEEFSQ